MHEPNFKEIVKKYLPDKTLEDDTPSLDVTDDSFRLIKELLEKINPIIETRNKIKKEQDDITDILQQVVYRLDGLISLKSVNAEKENEVLDLLKQELIS